jgi:Transposase DDE domain
MERFTDTLSVTKHLLAATARLGRVGHLPGGVGTPSGKTRWPERHQLGGSDGRWDVFPGKKRGPDVGKTKKGKGTKIMILIDGEGTPLGADIASASQAEVNLIEPLLNKRTARRRPSRLLYDRAADSDPLRKRLAKRCIELICPHRKNRTRPKTQDGRKLRRYKRRYKVERSISWLFNNRRLLVRYSFLFHAFVQLACAFTILTKF